MRIIKNLILTIVLIILVVLINFNVYNFVCINLLHKDLATVNGYAFLEVISGSMEPTIYKGDIIVINTNCQEYRKDDIITFRDINEAFVTHRILEIDNNKNTMITKGDANQSIDEEMSTNAIIGKYVMKIPAAGMIASSFKNPLVMILILVIGIIVCALVSTDSNLLPKDLSDEEKEFLEFKRQKELEAEESKKKSKGEIKPVTKKTTKSTTKKGEVKKVTKTTTTKKTTTAKKSSTTKKTTTKKNK